MCARVPVKVPLSLHIITHVHVSVPVPDCAEGAGKAKMSEGSSTQKRLSFPASLFTSNSFSVIEDDAFAGLSHLQYL